METGGLVCQWFLGYHAVRGDTLLPRFVNTFKVIPDVCSHVSDLASSVHTNVPVTQVCAIACVLFSGKHCTTFILYSYCEEEKEQATTMLFHCITYLYCDHDKSCETTQ